MLLKFMVEVLLVNGNFWVEIYLVAETTTPLYEDGVVVKSQNRMEMMNNMIVYSIIEFSCSNVRIRKL